MKKSSKKKHFDLLKIAGPGNSGALAFITLMGIVSLFSDMTHEGARSILGEYLDRKSVV